MRMAQARNHQYRRTLAWRNGSGPERLTDPGRGASRSRGRHKLLYLASLDGPPSWCRPVSAGQLRCDVENGGGLDRRAEHAATRGLVLKGGKSELGVVVSKSRSLTLASSGPARPLLESSPEALAIEDLGALLDGKGPPGDAKPEKRTLLQVKVGDVSEADEIFSKLMGDIVEPRREFIQENALNVSNLDV